MARFDVIYKEKKQVVMLYLWNCDPVKDTCKLPFTSVFMIADTIHDWWIQTIVNFNHCGGVTSRVPGFFFLFWYKKVLFICTFTNNRLNLLVTFFYLYFIHNIHCMHVQVCIFSVNFFYIILKNETYQVNYISEMICELFLYHFLFACPMNGRSRCQYV